MTNEEMTERLVEVEQRSKSNTHRIDAVEKNQEALNSIATSVAVMAEQQKNISDKVDTIDAKVDTLEAEAEQAAQARAALTLLLTGEDTEANT